MHKRMCCRRACLGYQLPTQIFKDYVLEVKNTVDSYIVTECFKAHGMTS